MKKGLAFSVILTILTAAEALFFQLEHRPLDSPGMTVCAAFNAVLMLVCIFFHHIIVKRRNRDQTVRSRSNGTRLVPILILTWAAGGSVLESRAQPTQGMNVCEADQIAAFRGETLKLKYYGATARSSIYWSATDGVIVGDAWTLKDVAADTSTTLISASAHNKQGTVLCRFDVAVLPDDDRANEKFTRTGFITPDQQANLLDGYGMYTYLIFTHPPRKDESHRDHTLLEAYFRDLTATLEVQQQKFFPRDRINIFLLPVAEQPKTTPKLTPSQLADWTLDHPSQNFSDSLTLSLDGQFTEGPYIVSCRRRLSGSSTDHEVCPVQDLSAIPEFLLADWIQHVVYQAAHQDTSFSLQTFSLEMRTIIAQIATDQPNVSAAVYKVLDFRKRVR